jgi:hypothetical protein
MRWYTAVAAKRSPDRIDQWTQNSLSEDRITIRSDPSNRGSFPLPPMTASEVRLDCSRTAQQRRRRYALAHDLCNRANVVVSDYEKWGVNSGRCSVMFQNNSSTCSSRALQARCALNETWNAGKFW